MCGRRSVVVDGNIEVYGVLVALLLSSSPARSALNRRPLSPGLWCLRPPATHHLHAPFLASCGLAPALKVLNIDIAPSTDLRISAIFTATSFPVNLSSCARTSSEEGRWNFVAGRCVSSSSQ
ncbi:hypothetical protein FIBSPDRAFT_570231 [Athelia psychrophila]|uniref:Uncharacterized protein n=1 Tax=Athelia psychrophila TaxID=1759441 RepID=A0A166HQQ9_9AGAM|nr:hypothetical protein FIBSPDRAFT_570231 [Fibularhizoctonia sp. CBS 109695]